MTISAKIIADSVSASGKAPRLTTFQLKYPRFIHAELMTHRVFSRNASSSRAIPVSKMIDNILNDTAMPIHWGKNQRGMQADEENNASVQWFNGDISVTAPAKQAWYAARDNAIYMARAFDVAGYHKQIVNRILEPFMHIEVVLTATQYANWFHLRCHKDAMPEIQELANIMYDLYSSTEPNILGDGRWHLPYVSVSHTGIEDALATSVACCARVSYLNHNGTNPSLADNRRLHEMLIGNKKVNSGEPLHASPAEHQARVSAAKHPPQGIHGNFAYGWEQYRKMIDNECVDTFSK